MLDPTSARERRLRLRLHAEQASVTGDVEPLRTELDAARAAGGVALAEGLSLLHHCMLGPADVARRLDVADELLAVALTTGRHLDISRDRWFADDAERARISCRRRTAAPSGWSARPHAEIGRVLAARPHRAPPRVPGP
jgi:hypothetical protein